MFNKKYKKYIADTAKAFEAFINKQSDSMDNRLEEFKKQNKASFEAVNDLNKNIDGIYDYLDSKEKAQLYTVCTPFDIKDLEPMAQEFLVGALFCLTKDRTPNEDQQAYLRSVMHYLNLKEPSAETIPSSIENIEDLSAQKAILQAVMEYLCLQDGDSYDETELQQEFLDAFSVNNKSRQAISEHVEQLYIATGAKGLAEKYGYVADGETSSAVKDEVIQALESALDDLAKSSSSDCPTIEYIHTMDLPNYEDLVSAGLGRESFTFKSSCESEAKRCLDLFYNQAEYEMRQKLNPSDRLGIYTFFKTDFDKNYAKVNEIISSLSPSLNNQVTEKINSYLVPSKVYDEAKNILGNLQSACSLPPVEKYRSSIKYSVDDPSEYMEGFMKFVSKAGKTYGYSLYNSTEEICKDVGYQMKDIFNKFNSQIQEHIFTSIVDPINKLIPQLTGNR